MTRPRGPLLRLAHAWGRYRGWRRLRRARVRPVVAGRDLSAATCGQLGLCGRLDADEQATWDEIARQEGW